jgi:hypothetical protein
MFYKVASHPLLIRVNEPKVDSSTASIIGNRKLQSVDRCKAGTKSRGAPGNAVGIHLAEHPGVAHVHLQTVTHVT